MALYLRSLLLVYFCFVVIVSRAEESIQFDHGFLYGRAVGDSDDSDSGLQCKRSCEVSFGSSQGPRSFARRSHSSCDMDRASANNVRHPPHFSLGCNENATAGGLTKRVFEHDISNGDAAKYVIDALFGGEPHERFFDGTARPITFMREFKTDKFRLGTPGLHGCTMVAFISNRAVYMGHFWETYSTYNKDDTDKADEKTMFIQRVVNAVLGVPVPEALNPEEAYDSRARISRNHKYRPPPGPPIDWSMFNQRGDNTIIYIMTPLSPGVGEGSTNYEYQRKYKVLFKEQMTLRARCRGCRVVMYGYKRLRYIIDENGREQPDPRYPEEWEEFTNSKRARGMALFEYDGEGSWRLFFEDKPYTKAKPGKPIKRDESG